MAAPTVRAVGTIASGTGTISPGLPSGTVAGDLLLMFCETDNTAVTASGWTEHPGSPVSISGGNATRLTVLYKIAAGSDATTTNDPGDHVTGRIIGVTKDTFDPDDPFDVYNTGTETTSDASGSCPGATTTNDDCLVFIACAGYVDGTNITTEFSAWTNSNLSSLTERIDNRRSSGNGGLLGVATGVMATAGDYGSTTFTTFDNTNKAMMSFAVNPAPPPTGIQLRQSQAGHDGNNGASGTSVDELIIDLPSSTVTGDLIAVHVWVGGNSTDNSGDWTVTDEQSNTYTKILSDGETRFSGSGSGSVQAVFVCESITGGSNPTITITLPATRPYIRAIVWNFYDVDGGDLTISDFGEDDVYQTVGSGDPWVAPTVDVAVDDVVCINAQSLPGSVVYGAGTGYENLTTTGGIGGDMSGATKKITSAGTEAGTLTSASSDEAYGAAFVVSVVSGTTYYGAFDLGLTLTIGTAGVRKRFGAFDLQLAVGETVAGFKKTFGAADLPLTFGETVAGFKKTTGSFSVPLALDIAVSGARKTTGAFALPLVLTIDTAALAKRTGSFALPLDLSIATVGRMTAFGAISVPLSFNATVAGFAKKTGSFAVPLVVTIDTAGDIRNVIYGAFDLGLVLGLDTAGFAKKYGVFDVPLSAGISTAGFAKKWGSSSEALSLAIAVDGFRKRFGATATPLSLSIATAGFAKKYGVADVPLVFGAETVARMKALASFGLPLELVIYTAGRGGNMWELIALAETSLELTVLADGSLSLTPHSEASSLGLAALAEASSLSMVSSSEDSTLTLTVLEEQTS